MNFKKLIVFFLIFSGLSYFYMNHELEHKSVETEEEFKSGKIVTLEDGEEISYLSIERDGQKFVMQKGDAGIWYLLEPLKYRADARKVNGLVAALSMDKKVRDLDNTDFDLEGVGLAEGLVKIGIAYGDMKRTLVIGNTLFNGENRYARWEDSADVFVVSDNLYSVFQVDLETLRSRKVCPVSVVKVTKFDISFDDNNIVLAKTLTGADKGWWITAPFNNVAKESLVQKYLNSIADIIVNKFYDDMSIDDTEPGFSKSSKFIAFEWDGGSDRLIIGKKTDDDKHYYAYFESEKVVFDVGVEIIDELQKTWEYFLDKRIYHFFAKEIISLSFKKAERKEVYCYDGQMWCKGKEKIIPDDITTIARILDKCAVLEYEFILSDDEKSALVLNDEVLLGTVLFERQNNEQEVVCSIYAVGGYSIVRDGVSENWFAISQTDFDELNDLLKALP